MSPTGKPTRIEGVVVAVQRANTLRASLTGAVDEIAKDVHAIQARIGDFASGFGDIAARIDELVLSRDERVDACRRVRGAPQSSESRSPTRPICASTSSPIGATRSSREVQRLVFQQSNEIFLAQPDLLAVRGPDGRTVLGFDETTPLGREGYRSFEDVFRGSEEFVRERQRPYLDLVGAGDRVADLGAGRGEMLDLLREAGATAIGVDLDAAMVERMREKGLDVEHADAVEWLAARDDASLDVIFSAQFVEHLPTAALPGLLAEARRSLAPGGRFIAETVNPYAPAALRAFWVDPTHIHPLYPETLLVLAQQAGFSAGYVMYPLADPIVTAGGDPRVEAGEYAVVLTR